MILLQNPELISLMNSFLANKKHTMSDSGMNAIYEQILLSESKTHCIQFQNNEFYEETLFSESYVVYLMADF